MILSHWQPHAIACAAQLGVADALGDETKTAGDYLVEYRDKTGIPAKHVVVGMCSNGFSLADPNDAGQLDVVGFDAAAPAVIGDFIAGAL